MIAIAARNDSERNIPTPGMSKCCEKYLTKWYSINYTFSNDSIDCRRRTLFRKDQDRSSRVRATDSDRLSPASSCPDNTERAHPKIQARPPSYSNEPSVRTYQESPALVIQNAHIAEAVEAANQRIHDILPLYAQVIVEHGQPSVVGPDRPLVLSVHYGPESPALGENRSLRYDRWSVFLRPKCSPRYSRPLVLHSSRKALFFSSRPTATDRPSTESKNTRHLPCFPRGSRKNILRPFFLSKAAR